ncbi:unnamed protein product [Acanthoscelides obtectus]|uniref:Uncharacterized protein n=1 Tax=Acanthoscelides obtectus TaxID=200917 RepID=A0A9P0P943_ACAOB|nr:unnamed protein product [Acanthoscelides obtectus]CAK1657554.1 hypothetical protein AOBTE_LOCUS20415 [Acanthoscelides obtectus]
MAFELILLSGLIFIFILSFCGLLQKIKQSYEREQIIAERLARRHEDAARRATIDSVYVNSAYIADIHNESGIFPEAPPPYICKLNYLTIQKYIFLCIYTAARVF